MQQIVRVAAIMLFGVSLPVTIAKADMNYGPIVDQAKGLCFQKASNTDLGFGYWTECPKTVAPQHRRPKHS
jgi:hypothetical protein